MDDVMELKYGVRIDFAIIEEYGYGFSGVNCMTYSIYEKENGKFLVTEDEESLMKISAEKYDMDQIYLQPSSVIFRDKSGEDIDIDSSDELKMLLGHVVSMFTKMFD